MTVRIDSEAHISIGESAGFVEICVTTDDTSQASYAVLVSTTDVSTTGEDFELQLLLICVSDTLFCRYRW